MDKFELTRLQQERLETFDVLFLAELPDIIADMAWLDAICTVIDDIQYKGMNEGIKA